MRFGKPDGRSPDPVGHNRLRRGRFAGQRFAKGASLRFDPDASSDSGSVSHPLRRSIRQTLRSLPGLNQRQIGGAVSIDPELALYHIARLIEQDEIVSFESPRGNETVCFHAEDGHLWQDERTRVLFGQAETFKVASDVVLHPRSRTSAIAGRSDRTPSSVRHHLRKLESFDLVRSEQHGRRVYYSPTEALSEWWSTVGERRQAVLRL